MAIETRKNGGLPPGTGTPVLRATLADTKSRQETISRMLGRRRPTRIRRFRQQHSLPVLNALKVWLDNIAAKIEPDTKLGNAVSFTLNQWNYLTRYISDGRMPTDTNILERDIRVFATGRKWWLFSDTADGAKASAVVYSLMLTRRVCGRPLSWLRYVLLSCRSGTKRPKSTTCCRSTTPRPPRRNRAG